MKEKPLIPLCAHDILFFFLPFFDAAVVLAGNRGLEEKMKEKKAPFALSNGISLAC